MRSCGIGRFEDRLCCTCPPHKSTCDPSRYFPSCTRDLPWRGWFVVGRCRFVSPLRMLKIVMIESKSYSIKLSLRRTAIFVMLVIDKTCFYKYVLICTYNVGYRNCFMQKPEARHMNVLWRKNYRKSSTCLNLFF